jgi:predicted nucleic acid-binding protein
MAQNTVLIDSSVWIQYFKQGASSLDRAHLNQLLAEDRVAMCGPIKAEVLSGIPSVQDFHKLSNWLGSLPYLTVPDEIIWNRIAESRFKLARKGIQQKLIDLLIAWTAHYHNVSVWSLDKDFSKLAGEISFKIHHP